MTLAGVFLGATIPYHPFASYPVTNSPIAGTSGSASWRVVLVTPNARKLPALMYPIAAGIGLNKTCTWPLSRSGNALVRYGTWSILIPAIILNNSPDVWGALPVPDDAMLILSGSALAYAI